MMRYATIVFIFSPDRTELLLGYKKKGEIGAQTLNGPGGKQEPGETLQECAVRETYEEVGITIDPDDLHEVAHILFHAGGIPDFAVTVYHAYAFVGTPIETADMVPGWYSVDELPFDRMLESDREWFARAITGVPFRANVFYRGRAEGFERIEFLTP